MRNPGLAIVLVLLGFIPIATWGFVAYGVVITHPFFPTRTAPYTGIYLFITLLAITPALVGGISMIAGAALLARKPLGARITATIGLVLIILTVVVFVAFEGPASGHEMMISGAAYVLLHVGVLVWLWRGWRRPAV